MSQAAEKITAANAPFRAVRLGPRDVTIDRKSDGTIYLHSPHVLPAYPEKLNERLVHWATVTPETTYMADRVDGAWRHTTYADTLAKARNIGQALLDRNLSPERPVAILSGNNLEHQWLMLGAMHVGIPAAAISPAYSLISTDFANLKHIFAKLTPGLVFVNDGDAFSRAIERIVPPDVEIVAVRNAPPGRRATPFAELIGTKATSAVDAAFDKVGPDTIAKFMFTSGSTGQPKASSIPSACCARTRR